MSFNQASYDQNEYLRDAALTGGVIGRRIFAWLVDLVLIGLLLVALCGSLLVFGIITLGLGFGLIAGLPFVPFCYHMFFLMSSASATPGQQLLGLTVRRDDDLGPPFLAQAFVSTLLFYLSLAFFCLPLALALFTKRKRTLHDLLSGLVMVRVRALDALTPAQGAWNMYSGPTARP